MSDPRNMAEIMRHSERLTGADDGVVSSIRDVPITEQRKPFMNSKDSKLQHPGTARANLAPSVESPQGTKGWKEQHSHQTVLQQHCDFFDRDHDGILWPQDTFVGFYRLGFGVILSIIAVFVIHANFSYPTCSGWLPDPFFRLFLKNVHKDKHGSDTGTYDTEGRFLPQKFEDIFAKHAEGRDYLTIWDVSNVLKGQRCIADPIGWGGAFFEWIATYIMLWPEDGRMMKEDIRRIYDGSIFYTLAKRREKESLLLNGEGPYCNRSYCCDVLRMMNMWLLRELPSVNLANEFPNLKDVKYLSSIEYEPTKYSRLRLSKKLFSEESYNRKDLKHNEAFRCIKVSLFNTMNPTFAPLLSDLGINSKYARDKTYAGSTPPSAIHDARSTSDVGLFLRLDIGFRVTKRRLHEAQKRAQTEGIQTIDQIISSL